MDVGAWHPEGGYMLCHPSEMRAEAVCALSSSRPSGPGDTSGGRVGFSKEGSKQQHRGPEGNMKLTIKQQLTKDLERIDEYWKLCNRQKMAYLFQSNSSEN